MSDYVRGSLYPAQFPLLFKDNPFFQLAENRALPHFRGLRALSELALFCVGQNPAVAQALAEAANERLVGFPLLLCYLKLWLVHDFLSASK